MVSHDIGDGEKKKRVGAWVRTDFFLIFIKAEATGLICYVRHDGEARKKK